MTSVTGRPSASLAVPATQNTAPILEFRCLYTHDLRQKKKRWQDGFLRFHTFNKRVMVYDSERNFIGDTHWRNDQAVQDGDDLKLDKGVLIQVGEETGRTEQDLTELLERRRPTQDTSPRSVASPSSNPSAAIRSTAAPLTQLRPKSLNALLGTPRGAYGRAILPTTSPYEARNQPNNRNVEAEPPRKRQRIDAQGGSRSASNQTTSRPIKPKMPSGNTTKGVVSLASSKRTSLPRDVITVDSDNESQVQLSPADNGDTSVRNAPKRPDKRAKEVLKAQETAIEICNSRAKSVAKPLSSVRSPVSASKGFRNDDDKPVNPLRIAPSKARKKLMYRELLPITHTSRAVSINGDIRISGLSHGLSACEGISLPPDDLETFHRAQQKVLTSRLEKYRDHKILGQQGSPHDLTIEVGDQTVRGPGQEVLSNGSPIYPAEGENLVPSDKGAVDEESLFISQDTPLEENWLSKMDQILLVPPDATTAATARTTPSRPLLSPRIAAPPTTKHPDSHIDPDTTKPPKKPPAITPAPQTSITKDRLQQSDGPSPPKCATLPPSNPRRSPLKKALSASSERMPSAKAPLPRAVSDITNLRSVAKVTAARRGKVEIENKDLGPWSREAFDLFGWRPGDEKGVGQKAS
ncbi:hypothetical protein MMC13_008307 [Lambiella insularis]|nr:hypothetical protein [Lambiella insularis]